MSKPLENAFWIWDGGVPTPVNAYRYFRRAFVVPNHWPVNPVLRICADTRYKLFVNGRYEANGPAPSARHVSAYDEITLSCNAGDVLLISVLVHYVGEPMFMYHRNRGGLIVELEDLVSDADWQVAVTSPYAEDSPRLSVQQGYAENFNERDEAVDFTCTDDPLVLTRPDQWKPATVIEKAYGLNWPVMQASDIAPRCYEEAPGAFQPARLIEYGNCKRGGGTNAAERTTNDVCLPLTTGSVKQVAERTYPEFLISCEGRDIFLTFDFGREVSGLPYIIHALTRVESTGAYVDVAYVEALRPDAATSGVQADLGDEGIKYADCFQIGVGTSGFQTFSHRAFRYLRLVVRNATGAVRLETPSVITRNSRQVGLTWQSYGPEDRGEAVPMAAVFTCSDARLDRIYEIGKHTLQLCMEDRFMDCPWRERAQWVADARLEAIGARYCFGDSLLHRRFLRQTALSQYPDGRIDPVGPGEWDALKPNTPIPGFIALYILSVLDYYQMTGDGALIEEVIPAVQKALGWLASHGAGEGGLLADIPGWNFTDWAPGLEQGNEGITAGVNLFYLQSLRAAARLAELMGDTAAAASNRTRADMVAAAFDSLFWNPLRGVYVDGVIGGEQSAAASQQVNSLVLLSEIGSDARRASVAERLLADDSLTPVGTPYFGYYLVQGLAQSGNYQAALDYIRGRWGAMMDAGATSWWETWDGLRSLCHGWSIAPSIWLPQQILGITASEPGFSTVDIAPITCDLTCARGIVPLPQGEAQVSWLKKEDRLIVDVTVPTGVLVRPILPCAPGDNLFVDGEPVAPDQIVRRNSTEAELAVLPGSGYRFEIVRP